MTAVVFDVGNVLIRWDPRLVWAEEFRSAAELDGFLQEIGFDAWSRTGAGAGPRAWRPPRPRIRTDGR